MKNFPFSLPLLLDGATGTQLQKFGMPAGACTESWALENPDAIIGIQRAYVSAGSKAVMAPTFGCNRVNLDRHGLPNQTRELCLRLVELSRKAVGGLALIGGDIAPCGLLIEPFGEHSFEEVSELFSEQAGALDEAGVDFFMVETQLSAGEAKAALAGVKAVSDRPVFVSFSITDSGRSFWGEVLSDEAPLFSALGAAAFGVNCCGDLALIEKVLREIRSAVDIPLIAKPNAGLPREAGGAIVYDMAPAELAAFAPKFMDAGALIIGGCCGTTEEHIAAIAASINARD